MTRIRTGPPARAVVIAALALASIVLLAACGSGGSSSSSGSTEAASGSTTTTGEAAKKLTGSPIKTFTVTTVNASDVPVYPAVLPVAEAFEQYVNNRGGIDGHPLQIKVCDDRGETSAASACAREAVEEEAVAGVGSFSYFGSAVVPILEKADTAWFGFCCAQSSQELTSKVSFPMGSVPANGAGIVAKAYEEGCQTVNAVILEGAGPVFEPILENAAKASGGKIGKFVNLPAEAKDYSPQVAEALSGGADCVIGIIAETQYQAFMPAWQESGTEARMYGVQGNLNEPAVEGFEEVAEGSVIGGVYPDLSTRPFAKMREALAESGAPTDLEYDSLTALGAWNGYTGFLKIVEGMKGPINHKTFLEAASKTTALETEGQVPTLNFTKEWTDGPEGFSRLFNHSVAFAKIEGGKVVPVSDKLYDATGLMLGEGKLGPGVSP